MRRLGNHGRRARGVRIRSSEQRLRARIRRRIRAQWNLNFAWRRPVPGVADVGHSKVRPRSSCCWYCRCRCRKMGLVRNAALHRRRMLPSKAAPMRRATLPIAAPRRCRVVSAAFCPPPVVRCNRRSSAATAAFQSDRVALSQRHASIASHARNPLCWKLRSLSRRNPVKSVPL